MKGIFVSYCLFLLGLGCCVSGYSGNVPRGGSYSLPSIGRYPAPTPTFPGRDHGLPPVYHGKFKRSAEEDFPMEFKELHAVDDLQNNENFKRSVDDERALNEDISAFSETQQFETKREKRRSRRKYKPTRKPPGAVVGHPDYKYYH